MKKRAGKGDWLGSHVFWIDSHKTNKSSLPLDSSHSKFVKRSVATQCFQNAKGFKFLDEVKAPGLLRDKALSAPWLLPLVLG